MVPLPCRSNCVVNLNPLSVNVCPVVTVFRDLPPQYYWVYANEALFRAISAGVPQKKGPRSRHLYFVIQLSKKLKIQWEVVLLVGLVAIVCILLRQVFYCRHKESGRGGYCGSRFFVGFGAGAEGNLFSEYVDGNKSDHVERLNQRDLSTFFRIHRVKFSAGIGATVSSYKTAVRAVQEVPEVFKDYRDDIVLNVIKRIGYYSYLRTWFEFYTESDNSFLREVAFVSPDVAAFAAVDAGLPTCYLQHGMIRRSILFPSFDRIVALTVAEAAFMTQRVPKAVILCHPRSLPGHLPEQMNRTMLVASVYGLPELMPRIVPLLNWARERTVSVEVRLHPCEDGIFWRSNEVAEYAKVQTDDASFFPSMDRLRPRFLVSWFSTTMMDALECGVIPVSVCADDDIHVADMVYPLFQCCLRWPQDAESLERLLDDDEYYTSVLSRLRAGLRGEGAIGVSS